VWSWEDWVSTLGRAMTAAGLAIALGSCASAPTGHYRFALAAKGALPTAWSLNSLPRHGRIDLLAGRTLTLRRRASTFELRSLAGGLVVSDLDFEDLGSS
jgi:hypothetical protein